MNLIDKLRVFLFASTGGLNLPGKIVISALILVIGIILLKLIKSILHKSLTGKTRNPRRINTIKQILNSMVGFLIFFICLVIIFGIFGINTSSLIATAGIGGVALGFGSQYLIKDIISGMVILLEEQYQVGDIVKISNLEGEVEEVSLRLTKIRDFNGDLHIIQNGAISIVTNRSRGLQRALVEVVLPYDVDLSLANEALEEACRRVKEEHKDVVYGPEILGITKLGNFGLNITIIARVSDFSYWGVERAIREKALEELEKRSINLLRFQGGKDEV